MKTVAKLTVFLLCAGLLAACSTSEKKKEKYNRKIYLTEEDYMADLTPHAEKQRREAKPSVESEYVFNILPETEKNVYFFDERNVPQVPGQPSEASYKKEKRLWEKPKRYSPEQYYGSQPEESAGETLAPETDPYAGYDY